MDEAELLAIFDREQRIEVQVPGVIREDTGRVIRNRGLQERSGFIVYSALDEACADAEIEAQVPSLLPWGCRLNGKFTATTSRRI